MSLGAKHDTRGAVFSTMLQLNDLMYESLDYETSEGIMKGVWAKYQDNKKYMEEHVNMATLTEYERVLLINELEQLITAMHNDLLECATHGRSLEEAVIAGNEQLSAWRERLPIGEKRKSVKVKPWHEGVMPLDKVSKFIFNEDIEPGKLYPVSMGSNKAAKQVNAYVSLDFSQLPKGVKIGKLTPFHNLVYNAVITHCEAGNYAISVRMINEVITGRNTAIKDDRYALIVKCINDLRYTPVDIDMREVMAAYNNPGKSSYSENILMAGWEKVELNGKLVPDVVIVRAVPVLYYVANNINQIARIPRNAYLVPCNNTMENILLKNYILGRIAGKYSKEVILFSTVYKQIEGELTKDKKKKIRETVIKIFEYEKEIGWVKDYNIISKGDVKYYSVSFKLNNNYLK